MNEEGYDVRGGTFAGGPSQRQKNYASTLHEQDALISSYEHLTGLPDPGDALHRLRKIASLVKPIMRKRGWHVGTLTEFLPEDQRLLGLNINRGHKICVRLRYTHRPASFLPIEQCVDTMLHELSHIVHGPHDSKFHALWDELRNEHETLLMRGYTGEGFLTKGNRLGGGPTPPQSELRRLARQNAENRKRFQKSGTPSGGSRLGGSRILPGQDPRKVIADAIERRNIIDRGCASGSSDADQLARQSSQRTVMIKAEEDDANNRAIAEALLELMEEEERQRLGFSGSGPTEGLSWDPKNGLSQAPSTRQPTPPTASMSEEDQIKWAIEESMKAVPISQQPLNGDDSSSSSRHESEVVSRASSIGSKKRPRESSELGSSPAERSDGGELADLAGAIGAASGPRWVRDNGQGIQDQSKVSSALADFIDEPLEVQPASAEPPTRVDSMDVADEQTWTCEICTCINPARFLACDACGTERPAPPGESAIMTNRGGSSGARPTSAHSRALESGRRSMLDRSAVANLERLQQQSVGLVRPNTLGWSCQRCSTFMEHKYWTCSVCGLMKTNSSASEHAG